MTTNLAHVTVMKPAGATVTLTRRVTDSSNTVAITVNKSTTLTVQNDGAPLPPSPSWRAGAWK